MVSAIALTVLVATWVWALRESSAPQRTVAINPEDSAQPTVELSLGSGSGSVSPAEAQPSASSAGVTPAGGCQDLPKPGGGLWQCSFEEEFNGTRLNASRWQVFTNAADGFGWGNGCYVNTGDTISVRQGMLTLRASKGGSIGCPGMANKSGTTVYRTGAIQTKGKFSQRYGRFEIRAQLPAGKGMWPAFWMMPQDDVYGGWPTSGEIDIMEALGHDTTGAYATLHFINKTGKDGAEGKRCALADYSTGFHTYTLEWDARSLTMLYDSKRCYTFTDWSSQQGFPKPFDQRFYLILNLSVGGEWPGEPDAATRFPGNFVVDYVRAWK